MLDIDEPDRVLAVVHAFAAAHGSATDRVTAVAAEFARGPGPGSALDTAMSGVRDQISQLLGVAADARASTAGQVFTDAADGAVTLGTADLFGGTVIQQA